MAALAFDTLRFSKRLKTAGVPAAQAEAEAEVLSEIFEITLKELVTKEDLRLTKEDLRKDMDIRFAATDAKLEKLDVRFSGEMNLIKWMFGAMIASTVGILTKLFF